MLFSKSEMLFPPAFPLFPFIPIQSSIPQKKDTSTFPRDIHRVLAPMGCPYRVFEPLINLSTPTRWSFQRSCHDYIPLRSYRKAPGSMKIVSAGTTERGCDCWYTWSGNCFPEQFSKQWGSSYPEGLHASGRTGSRIEADDRSLGSLTTSRKVCSGCH